MVLNNNNSSLSDSNIKAIRDEILIVQLSSRYMRAAVSQFDMICIFCIFFSPDIAE